MSVFTRVLLVAVVLFVGAIFTKIFIERAEIRSGSIQSYISYAQHTQLYELKPYARNLLNDPVTSGTYFPIFLFHDYFVHSLNELERTITSRPKNFPYLGAYQFYTFVMLLNKLGFEIISAEMILSEIPNPEKITY